VIEKLSPYLWYRCKKAKAEAILLRFVPIPEHFWN
jgi:hypothetical protein